MGDENRIVRLPLSALRAHPMNANVMPGELFEKLVGHIERTGQYPPLIVRHVADRDGYEVLDGHHRWKALRRLGERAADCVVWPVDDTQSLVLMSTLNRLEGADDPRKRGALMRDLQRRLEGDLSRLAQYVPESPRMLCKVIDAAGPPPEPEPSHDLAEMPASVCFFLSGAQAERLGTALDRIGGPREIALMQMVDRELDSTKGGA